MSRNARVTRRKFLRQTGITLLAAGSAPVISAPFVSRAMADTKTLSIVQWSHFVPAYDKWFDKFAKDWGDKNQIEVTVDHIPVQDVAARAAAEASAGAGHDLFGWNGAGGAHLYRKFLVDLTSLVEAVQKKYGKISVIGRQLGYNQDDNTWSAFPDYYINFPVMYRKSLWDGIGIKPESWDDIRIGGAKLKQKGNPVGISLGHSNDPNTTWRGLLWSYGASVQDESGKHVTLNSKEAIEAVKLAVALYKEAFTPQVLSWDDASDNKYIDSGVGSFIINPISAYRSAQQINPELADKIFLWKCPKGPVRRLIGAASNSYGIWKFAKNKEAGLEFLKYYADNWIDAFKAATGYNMPIYANIVPKPMPILSYDPTSHPPTKLAVTETSDEWCAVAGWPGPAWAATDEVYNDFIVCDMMTKAALGQMTPEEAVKWATNETKLIFKKWEV